MKATGTYIKTSTAGESSQAFVPNPRPPDPSAELVEQDHNLVEKANRAIGPQDGVACQLPDASLFLYSHIRKEFARLFN